MRSATLDADEYHGSFKFLAGDTNGDGTVGITDFNVVSLNYGHTNAAFTYADGDFDYDHTVGITDFNLMATNYGQSLPDLPTQNGGVAVGNTTTDALDVAWAADPADPNSAEPRDGFKVYRSDDDGVTFALVATLADPAARTWQDTGVGLDTSGTTTTATTAADSALITGHKYWYRVRSYTDTAGAGPSVTRASGVVTHPTLPVTLSQAAGVGPGRIVVSWTPPANTDVVAYRVYRGTTSNFLPSPASLVAAVDGNKTAITDSGLSPGHSYYYRVVVDGTDASTSLPSLGVTALAQNEGKGVSNGGTVSSPATPFDPATHDSDNDGTPDALDNDNDNDGTRDEQDDDDDNNGVPDNSEPDDRDLNGDGILEIGEDGSDGSNPADIVPSGSGTFSLYSIFSGNQPIPVPDRVPSYVHFNASANEAVGSPPTVQPKLGFTGDGSQTFTFTNLPKHAFVNVAGSIYGNGFIQNGGPHDTGVITVKVNGQTIPSTPSFDGWIYSTNDKVTLTIEGHNFPNEYWEIYSLGVSVSLQAPVVTASAYEITEGEQEGTDDKRITFTVSRGPWFVQQGDLKVDLDWDLGTADHDDASGLVDSVTIPNGSNNVSFDVTINDDSEAEWTESLVAQIKPSKDYWTENDDPNFFKVDIRDNDVKLVLPETTLTINNDDSDDDGIIDFNDYNGVENDNKLYRAELLLPHPAPDGSLLSFDIPPQIRLWKNKNRTDEITRGQQISADLTHVFIEAISGSTTDDDIEISFQLYDAPIDESLSDVEKRRQPASTVQSCNSDSFTDVGLRLFGITALDADESHWNELPINGKRITMILGQYETMAVKWEGPTAGPLAYHWDTGDNSARYWDKEDENGNLEETPAVIPPVTDQAKTWFYYFTPGNKSVDFSVTDGNETRSGHVGFDVQDPAATLTIPEKSNPSIGLTLAGPGLYLRLGNTNVFSPHDILSPNHPGIYGFASAFIQAPSEGTPGIGMPGAIFKYIQTMNYKISEVRSSDNTLHTLVIADALDTTTGLAGAFSASSSLEGNDFVDSPGAPLEGRTWSKAECHFVTVAMFKAPGSSEYVPVQKVEWKFVATASFDATTHTWNLTDSETNNPTVSESRVYPHWTHVTTSSDFDPGSPHWS